MTPEPPELPPMLFRLPDSRNVCDDADFAEWLMTHISRIMVLWPYCGGAAEAAEILAIRGVLAAAGVTFDFPGLIYQGERDA